MSICTRIFERMGQDKSHLRALAHKLSIAPSTVTSWKTRGSDPPAKYIVAIADFLGVSPLWLLTGEDNSDRQKELPADNQAHQEVIELFDSLERPGQTLMLAAGYKEQMRQNELQHNNMRQSAPCPSICTLGDKLLTQKG